MSVGAVRQPRRGVRQSISRRDLLQRRRWEFRDVRHPERPELRLEHVTVCPSGIHVVTSLPESAVIPGGPPAPPGYLSASHAAADLVAALLPERYRHRVRPVLCHAEEYPMAEVVDGVLVTSPSTLDHIVSSSRVVLSTSEVSDVALRLAAGLEAFPAPRSAKGRRRWRRRHTLAAALAASSGALAYAVSQGIVNVTLPW